MKVQIYQPSRTAMQSGRARSQHWILECEATQSDHIDPLMGWTSCNETVNQIRLHFRTKDEAIAFAKRNEWSYQVSQPHWRRVRPKNYADKFHIKPESRP